MMAELTSQKRRDRDGVADDHIGEYGGQFPGSPDCSRWHKCGSKSHCFEDIIPQKKKS